MCAGKDKIKQWVENEKNKPNAFGLLPPRKKQ